MLCTSCEPIEPDFPVDDTEQTTPPDDEVEDNDTDTDKQPDNNEGDDNTQGDQPNTGEDIGAELQAIIERNPQSVI